MYTSRNVLPAGQTANDILGQLANTAAQPLAQQLAVALQQNPDIQHGIGQGVGEGIVRDAKPYLIVASAATVVAAGALVFMAVKRAKK